MALATLWPENIAAWRLFQQLRTRFVVDAGFVGGAFQMYTAEWSNDLRVDVLERLSVIYDLIIPPPEVPSA